MRDDEDGRMPEGVSMPFRPKASFPLRDKFRAVSQALRANFEAERAGGRHSYEKGLRKEQVLIEFLRTHLPPRYGVSRVLPAECVYAVMELKPVLSRAELAKAVVRSAKALDRSAVVAQHGGHRLHHGPRRNPPLFGAVFALKAADVGHAVAPRSPDR